MMLAASKYVFASCRFEYLALLQSFMSTVFCLSSFLLPAWMLYSGIYINNLILLYYFRQDSKVVEPLDPPSDCNVGEKIYTVGFDHKTCGGLLI